MARDDYVYGQQSMNLSIIYNKSLGGGYELADYNYPNGPADTRDIVSDDQRTGVAAWVGCPDSQALIQGSLGGKVRYCCVASLTASHI